MLYASCDRTDYFPSADWSLCNMFLRLCRPVWVPLLHQQWHGYEVHPAGRGRQKSWSCPRGRTWFPFPFCQLSEHPSDRRWDQPWTEQNLLLMKHFYYSLKTKPGLLLSNLIFVPTRVSYSLTLPCSTEGLVRGGGDQVSMFKGRGDGFGCHQATNMSHVSKQVGIDVGAQLEEKEAGWGNSYKIKTNMYTHVAGKFHCSVVYKSV